MTLFYFISLFTNRTEKASFEYVKNFLEANSIIKVLRDWGKCPFFRNHNMVTLRYKVMQSVKDTVSRASLEVQLSLHLSAADHNMQVECGKNL